MTIMRAVFLRFVLLAATGAAQTNAPASAPAATAAKEFPAFGEWSAEVNGLQVRVAALGNGRGNDDGVFLEIRNAGEKPLTIPSLALVVSSNKFPWHLQVGEGRNWKESPWGTSELLLGKFDAPNPRTEPAVILRPRETALLQMDGQLEDGVRRSQQFRMVLQQSGAGPISGWTGTLETPPVLTHPSEKQMEALAGSLSAPTDFPPFNLFQAYLANGSGHESPFLRLSVSNWRLIRQLSLYRDGLIAQELERRLSAESDFTLKLLLAEQAGIRRSTAGRDFILTAMKDLDYIRCKSTLDALRHLAEERDTPDWVFDAMIAALKDQRRITNLPSNWAKGTSFTVSDLADEDLLLALRLGDKKCRRALPALVELAKSGNHRRFAIEALGQIGDPQAVPALFEIAKNERANLEIVSGMLSPEIYVNALGALVDLKADGVEDELLANVVHEDIIKMLERMGDPGAIPALRQVISTGKTKPIGGSDADSDRAAVEAARLALAALEPGDPVPRYCALVQDRSLNEFTRREAVWRLAQKLHVDPRAIPVLLILAREDPSGTVVDNAIVALGEFHYSSAVSGLIELFGADYKGKQNWKYAYEPEMFREHVADSLQKVTGQSFGVDPAAWRKWWAQQDQSHFK